MKKQPGAAVALIAAFLLQAVTSSAQIKDILKAGGKAIDKSPSKLLDKYFSNAPITTSFDHAVTEVDLLGNFDPDSEEALPLSSLQQNERGDYIVTEGYYSGVNLSFCMKAGSYGPSAGDGHLYAPLVGPKAGLVRKIYENWLTKAPQLPQTTVQGLVWAIIARTDVDKMDIKYKAALLALLDKEDVAQLAAGSLKDKALEAGMDKIKGEIPAEIYRVFEAERELRRLYSNASTTYEDLERYAVLAGIAPASDMIRPVSKARWSYHPNGFFIRMFPSGYSRTRVDVYVPRNVQAQADQLGRISTLGYPGYKIEFVYDRATADPYATTGLQSMKLNLEGVVKTVALKQHGLNAEFVTNKFSFDQNAAKAGTPVPDFVKWFNEPAGALSFRLDAAAQRKAFNLASLVRAFEKIPESSMDKHLNAFVRHMLNEAYNHIIYTSLVYDPKQKAKINPDPVGEYLVNSGPGFSGEPVRRDEAELAGEHYSMDKGSLDLPNTVATPANRSAQRIGQSKPPKQPPWYDKLPDCPCTYKEAQAKAKQSGSGWMDCGKANQTYHYGATTEVRWKPSKPGQPGQQCTYDDEGNLITSGVGAGSPDKVSPHGCGTHDGIQYGEVRNFLGHNAQDMQPWETLPCWQYLRDWPANNGNKCAPSNPKYDLKHMRKLVGNMNCRDFTKMMQNANEDKSISKKLRDYLNGNGTLSDRELINELKDWKINADCHGKDLCRVIDQAIGNLQ